MFEMFSITFEGSLFMFSLFIILMLISPIGGAAQRSRVVILEQMFKHIFLYGHWELSI